MKDILLKAIKDYNMISKGDKVLCALSGGADSVALLLCLKEISKTLDFEVCACHLNHLIRGQEALRDEQFSENLCKKLNTECYISRKNAVKYSGEHGLSVETGARQLRYDFFNEACKVLGANKIATAHTASDNLETIIFNLSRGTAINGLCGIPPVRQNIIRPLIYADRQDIENYLGEEHQEYITDSTNNEDDYSRNKIRHKVIPVLKEIHKTAEKNAVSMSALLRADKDYIDIQAEKEFNHAKISYDDKLLLLNCDILRQNHEAISSRIIKKSISLFTDKLGEISNRHIYDILKLCNNKKPSASIMLPYGIHAYRDYNNLCFCVDKKTIDIVTKTLKIGNNRYGYSNHIVLSEIHKEKLDYFNNSLNTFYVSYDKIDFSTLCVRSRKEGDSIRLHKNGGHKKLKKLFIEKKISARERNALPIIADKFGVICIKDIGVNIDRLNDDEKLLCVRFED